MLCCLTIKRIDSDIVTNKACIDILEQTKKMVQTVLMRRSCDNGDNENDPQSDVSTKNSEADGLSPALQLFYSLLCILKRAQYASKEMAVICSDILELLTQQGEDHWLPWQQKRPLLHIACERGAWNCVRYLVMER